MQQKSFHLTLLATGAVALGLAGAAHASTNLVQNPNFDLDSPAQQTAPVDWTLTKAASGSDFFVGPGPGFGAFSSPNSANFGAVGNSDDELSQVLATTPGVLYEVSFELAHAESDAQNDFSATFGGTTYYFIVNQPEFGYQQVSFFAPATSSLTTLAFFGREVPSWYDLDNVSVTTSTLPVPEPASWAIMMLGFGLTGAVLRRRARKPAIA
jgi:hypothetical protein